MDKIKIEEAMKQAKANIEVDGVIITPEQEKLVRARLMNEITEEEFSRLALESIKGEHNGR